MHFIHSEFKISALIQLVWILSIGHTSSLPERCDTVAAPILNVSCNGVFPYKLKVKYRDTFIKPGEPFGVFYSPNYDEMLISMKKSKLSGCDAIKLIEPTKFTCYSNEQQSDLSLDNATLHCFPYHVQYLDDLTIDCLDKLGTIDDDIMQQVQKSKTGALVYTFGEEELAVYWLPSIGLIAFAVTIALAFGHLYDDIGIVTRG